MAAVLALAGCDIFTSEVETDTLVRAPFASLPSRFHNDVDWRPDGIYTAGLPAIARYTLDAELRVTSDDAVFEWPPEGPYGSLTTAAISPSGDHAVAVGGKWADAVAGRLVQVDLRTGTPRVLRDSTWNVAYARFLETGPLGRPGRVILYAFGYHPRTGGDPAARRPGYYILDLETGRDSLVLAATSTAGVTAGTHFFDVSPDGRTLVGPDYRPDAPVRLTVADLGASPVVGRPVAVTTALGERARSLAMRYRADGGALAYVANWFGATPAFANESSEIGVIAVGGPDEAAWVATPRRTRPYPDTGFLSQVVDWSPDGRYLAYTAAPLIREGPSYTPIDYSLFVGAVTP